MPWYVSGIDLGQLSDPTALVVLECHSAQDLRAVHLHRWNLGTPYTAIVDDLRELYATPPLTGSTLVVDRTGVGVAVVEMLAAGHIHAALDPWSITAGQNVNREGRTVPKKDLVAAVQAALGQGFLRIAEELELTPVLVAELEHFRSKITADRNETFASWRERDHDDLVLALALSCWEATSSGDPEIVRAANAGNVGRRPWDDLPAGTFDDSDRTGW